MKGLIIKDFINLRKNLKIFAIFIVLYGAMAVASQDTSFFTTVFTMLCAILTLSLYSYDEMAKWDIYAITMPVSKDNIVQGKYLMMLLLTAAGALIGSLFSVMIYVMMGVGSPVNEIKSCGIGAAIAILFYSISIPLITKLGVEKARFVLIAVYIIPFAAVILVGKAIEAGKLVLPEQITEMIVSLLKYLNILLPATVIFALLISYLVSINIYRKKEF
jgi:ABC-type transport system involved in multi-copper enzyme maturation permease subunit